MVPDIFKVDQKRLLKCDWNAPKPRSGVRQRLILCFDGTCKDSEVYEHEGPSNVYALYSSLREGYVQREGSEQIYQRALYIPGLVTKAWGTYTGVERKPPAIFWILPLTCKSIRHTLDFMGWGMERMVAYCVALLLAEHEEGDEIVFIGYSRGAFLLRIVASFIGRYGFDYFRYAEGKKSPGAARLTREQQELKLAQKFKELYQLSRSEHSEAPPSVSPFLVNEVKVLAVFDTVRGKMRPGKADPEIYLQHNLLTFTDGEISSNVKSFVHAISFDDPRDIFPPVFGRCTKSTKGQEAVFAGTHDDVGGPMSRARKALAFMAGVLSDQEGIRFSETTLKEFMLDPQPICGEPYDPPLFLTSFSTRNPREFWNLEKLGTPVPRVHESLANPDPQDALNPLIPQRNDDQNKFIESADPLKIKVGGLEWRLLQAYNAGDGTVRREKNVWMPPKGFNIMSYLFFPLRRSPAAMASVGKRVGGGPRRLRVDGV